jgi:hypothetical protein
VPAELTFIGTATTLLEIGPFNTMVFVGLDAIAERHGPVDAAVVHLSGTTLPGGFVVTMTGTDAEAAEGAGLGVEMRYVRRGESTPL